MRKKQIIILIIILAIIVAAVFILKLVNRHNERKEEASIAHPIIFDTEDVTYFSYTYDDTLLEFTRGDDGDFICGGDEEVDLDQESVEEILTGLTGISSSTVIENAAGLSEYGLEASSQTVSVKLSDGSEIYIYIGNENEMLGGYYIEVSDDANVYLADDTLISDILDKSLDDLAADDGEEDADSEDTAVDTASDENSAVSEDTGSAG